MESRTFTIYDNRHAVELKLNAMQRRAVKLGVIGFDYTVEDERVMRKHTREDGSTYEAFHTASTFTVTGSPVRFEGWTFLAAIDHMEGETIIRRLPIAEEVDLSAYRGSENSCSHCHQRRNRKTTYVLRHEDGRQERVGSTCVQDFLGGDPENAMKSADLWSRLGDFDDEDEWGCRGSRGDRCTANVDFLAWVSAAIERHGWTSKGKAYEDGSLSTCEEALQMEAAYYSPDAESDICPEERHRDEAAAANEWAVAISDEDVESNDYLANLRAIARVGKHTVKHQGLVASMISGYQREVRKREAAAEAEKQNAGKLNEYVGSEKERLCGLRLTVVSTRHMEDYYSGGTKTMAKLEDAEGRAFVWWCSTELDWEVGEVFVLDGTVKGHSEFNGRKETTLNRCTVKEEVAAASAA